jgi:hypothetical protein
MKAGGNTYVNQVGFDEAKLKKWVSHFEKLWGGLKGWRRKALDGGLTVVLATPKEFHGTAAGKYKSDKDQMLVRATPKILKRTGGSYGAPDYVLIHELAHRYERKHGAKYDFDRPEWQVTKYARKDGESFSELFAMGYFRPTNAQMVMSQDQANKVLDRFETLMGGKKTEGVIRFRDMVRHAVFDEDIGHLHLMSKKKKLKKAKVTGTDGDVPEAQGAEDKPGAGPVDNRRAKSIPF